MNQSEIAYLNNLLELPRLFGISYYFNELRAEIDFVFSLKTDLNSKETWIQFITKIDSFEKDCLKTHTKNQFNELLVNETLQVLNKPNDQVVYKQIVKLERILFGNRTLIFFNRSPVETLLIVKNEYFGKKSIDYIKGNSPIPSRLTQEALRSHLLKLKAELIDSTNNVTLINEIYFDLLETTVIDLSESVLKSIDSNAFEGLSYLISIDLSNNEISELDSNTFSGHCFSLNDIDLSGNTLTELNEYLFKDLKHLTIINLAYNDLKTVACSFNDLINLKHISFSSNQISSVELNAFKGLSQLVSIDLSSNHLKTIDPIVFNQLIKLKSLNLADNQIESLGLFCLPNLEYLNLAINNLRVFEKTNLDSLPSLIEINLSYNEIKILPSDLFKGLSHLSYIHLHNNYIESIQSDLFNGLDSLEHVYLADNKLDNVNKNLFEQFPISW